METKIQFANEKVQKAFEKLAFGNYEEKELKSHIEKAFKDILENAFCGVQIPRRLIPQDYIKKFGIKNVFKYNLPNAWRLLYSLEHGKFFIISIVLEWLDHKNYERRFNY